jgi:outer membrane lipoprotein-sorting protein
VDLHLHACRLLAAVAVAALLGACAPPAVERPYPPPTPAELLDALRDRARRLTSLRAEAKVDHLGEGGERVRLSMAMLLERGGKLRLEANSPLGGALATLVSDGKQFALLDVRQNRFQVGPALPCNVARLIRIELPPDDVVAVLMGGAPLEGDPLESSWDREHGGRERLRLRTPDGGQETLELDGRNRVWDVLKGERRLPGGEVLWRLEHESFRDHGGARLPERTQVEEPRIGSDARIRFRSVAPNVTPPEGAFHLDPPAGLVPERVDCSH